MQFSLGSKLSRKTNLGRLFISSTLLLHLKASAIIVQSSYVWNSML